ncbi:alpha-(1-_3)-arabinofuranosyltransferase [Lolliginicoccus levis]|uniref:alpha-(1->3)-arabinofuranosyltransferase n=1 Tax=Lolliginicoccus levis TaxID=2919542 RepID=UPI00241FE381|nr:alpha-(1->3)-arabinofuranosyltransferase [Lolliginicoccus levis]
MAAGSDPAPTVAEDAVPRASRPLSRWGLLVVAVVALVTSLLQAPGLLVADTKLDLVVDPIGFLDRASHLWSSLAPFGQTQNQAYGYFFPQGAFFAATDALGVPAWVAQRVWWAILFTAGFWGIVRVTEALGIGTRPSRIIAAAAYACSPRVLTTIGAISSETTPMMLAPWVLLPVILALDGRSRRPLWQLAAASAFAVACMGAINAVATAFGAAVAVVWWLAHRPDRRWWRFTAWWVPLGIVATAWWVVPLLMLGSVSPPFLDYIESAGTTTRWTSLVEVLRGTGSWTPFISPDRMAGAILVTQPVSVLATGLVAAAGLAGLALRSPARGRLVLVLAVGLVGIGVGYAGGWGSPISDLARTFLDGAGAPMRNVHKLEPLIRLPLAVGLAALLARAPLPGAVARPEWRRAIAHPERTPSMAVATAVVLAVAVATSLVWTGKLAPRGAHGGIPDYWAQTAQWLASNSEGEETGLPSRALVVPAAPFGSQVWGLTRDEPLQPLATTPWGSRDIVPLIPPGGIRMLDSVQRLLVAGQPSPGLASMLAAQGIRHVVLRNDIDPVTGQSVSPAIARQTLLGSPGLVRAEAFGGLVGPRQPESDAENDDWSIEVPSAGTRPRFPAIEIFEVVADPSFPAGVFTMAAEDVPLVQGGPEVLLRLHERAHPGEAMPHVLSRDALEAGLPVGPITVTDTPVAREADFGRVDHQRSHALGPDDPRRTRNRVADYATDEPLVRAVPIGPGITVSSSAGDATQIGTVQPGSGPAAAVDGNEATAWLSNSGEAAVGQWLQLDFDEPIEQAVLRITTSAAAAGAEVRFLEVRTENGSSTVLVPEAGEEVVAALPLGATSWARITARSTEDGSLGGQFGIADLSVSAEGRQLEIGRVLEVPPAPAGATVTAWDLGQEHPERRPCLDGPVQAICLPSLGRSAEEPGVLARRITADEETSTSARVFVRSRQSGRLEELLAGEESPRGVGPSSIGDTRGNAFAAADGDPRTVWYAPATSSVAARELPSVTVELPGEHRVERVEVTLPRADVPAKPTVLRVDTGESTTTLRLTEEQQENGTVSIPVPAAMTESVEVTILDWRETRTSEPFGLSSTVPPGIADIAVLSSDGLIGARDDAPRIIEIDCEDGPRLEVGEETLQFSVSMTEAEARAGTVVEAIPCGSPAVRLGPGTSTVTVDPGELLHVDGARLESSAEAGGGSGSATSAEAREWSPARRVVEVEAASDELLVVPESRNSGWVAHGPDGAELVPVTVNGWQQGWLVPAGTTGAVTLSYPLDSGYRLALFGGLALLVPLGGVLLLRREGKGQGIPPSRAWRSRRLAMLGGLAATFFIAGLPGAGLYALVAASSWAMARRWGSATSSRALSIGAGTAMALSAAVLSTGPWRSPSGYLGDDASTQALALVAVAAVVIAAWPPGRGR